MPMPAYPLYCYTKDCKNLALYKIAAQWSDGKVGELKTYGLCCEQCLPTWFRRGRASHQTCQVTPGETLEAPGIYRLQHGQRDRKLQRVPELEAQFG